MTVDVVTYSAGYLFIGLLFVLMTIVDVKRLIKEAGGIKNYSKDISLMFAGFFTSVKIPPKIAFWLMLISIIIFDIFLWPFAIGIILINSCGPASY